MHIYIFKYYIGDKEQKYIKLYEKRVVRIDLLNIS